MAEREAVRGAVLADGDLDAALVDGESAGRSALVKRSSRADLALDSLDDIVGVERCEGEGGGSEAGLVDDGETEGGLVGCFEVAFLEGQQRPAMDLEEQQQWIMQQQ